MLDGAPETLQGGRPQSPSACFSQAAPAIYSPGLNQHLFTLPKAAGPKVEQEVLPTALERKEGADGEQAALQPEEDPSERSRREATAPAQLSQWEET